MRISSGFAAAAAIIVGATAEQVNTEGIPLHPHKLPMRPHRVPLFPGAVFASSSSSSSVSSASVSASPVPLPEGAAAAFLLALHSYSSSAASSASVSASPVPIPEAPTGQEVAAPEDLLPGVGPVMVTSSLPLEEAHSRRLPRATKFANGTASATTKARLGPKPTGESPEGEEASSSMGPEVSAALAAAKKASADGEASIRQFLATMSRVPDGMVQPRQLVVPDITAWTNTLTKGFRPSPVPTVA